MPQQPTGIPRPIPDVEYKGIVRTRDPETSWFAASQQTKSRSAILRADIHWILTVVGPLNDSEIVARYDAAQMLDPLRYRNATPQSVRTRRHELEVVGLVADTDTKRPSEHGGPSTVWRAAA